VEEPAVPSRHAGMPFPTRQYAHVVPQVRRAAALIRKLFETGHCSSEEKVIRRSGHGPGCEEHNRRMRRPVLQRTQRPERRTRIKFHSRPVLF
jgi:hypothetical protein